MNRAIILINDDETDYRDRAAECIEQSERRGYGFVALMRDMDRAIDLALRRVVSAVIFPGRTHRPRPAEPSADDTAVLTIQVPAMKVIGRRALTPEWVRDLVDADALMQGVEGYREGYTDGFVDCLMIRERRS